jgi:hypothetical protein
VSNILSVTAGELDYCPNCADVYGQVGGIRKRCRCVRSSHIAEPGTHGDFPTPFEICWYCQAEIVHSGSRWSTYYCENCRIRIINLNDMLEMGGFVGLPIGRHTLMHLRWPSARPLTSGRIVARWREERLREAWKTHSLVAFTDEWTCFAEHMRGMGDSYQSAALMELVHRVQKAPIDFVTSMTRDFNMTRRIQ